MTTTTEDKILQQLNTLTVVLLGVADSDSKGLVGDIKDIKKTIECHNKDISRIKLTLYVLAVLTLGTGGTVITRFLGG